MNEPILLDPTVKSFEAQEFRRQALRQGRWPGKSRSSAFGALSDLSFGNGFPWPPHREFTFSWADRVW